MTTFNKREINTNYGKMTAIDFPYKVTSLNMKDGDKKYMAQISTTDRTTTVTLVPEREK